jgi:hypothetical protein
MKVLPKPRLLWWVSADEIALGADQRLERRKGAGRVCSWASQTHPLKKRAASELEPQAELDASRIVASSAENAEVLWRIEAQPG